MIALDKSKLLLLALVCAQPKLLFADVNVAVERVSVGNAFSFRNIESPAINDFGATAKWMVIDGAKDRNSADIKALYDGRVPTAEDDPRGNFFFAAGSDGGRIAVDLRGARSINRITTYSRHPSDRAPQVYTVYGSTGTAASFNATPGRGIDPKDCGWNKIAAVDTRTKDGEQGGRHAASITDKDQAVGRFRYLLFDVQATEKRDPFGLTFFSEIDIVVSGGKELDYVSDGKPLKLFEFQTRDAKYQFQIDATEAPDLHDWSREELAPVIRQWYPKIVAMLPSDGYQAPTKITLTYRGRMPAGIPASASGSRIQLNAPWFRGQLKREAKGCVVHELVHVVQNYWRVHRVNPNAKRTPSWLVEGLADYIRWFLYEPESRGALLSPKRLAAAKHDASYRASANFIDWVARNHDKDIARKLNAAARHGAYDDSLWQAHTGFSVDDLAEQWRKGESP